MQLIGLSGKMGVGKSTVANMIVKQVPGAERAAFGDILKREVAEAYQLPLVYLYEAKHTVIHANAERIKAGWPEGIKTLTVRELLQWYGTDFVRAQNPDYWIVAMREHLRSLRDVPLVILDDVRFGNEANLVLELGGKLVRIEPYPGYTVSANIAAHASETALDEWDHWHAVYTPAHGEEELKRVAMDVIAEAK